MDYNFKKINNNDLVKGKVVFVNKDYIELDLNSFAPGILEKKNFSSSDVDLNEVVKINDELECVVLRVLNGDEQAIYLSRLPLIKKDNLNALKEKYENKEIITPKFIKEVNGGYIYSYLSYDLFMPKSQYVENMNEAIIIEFDSSKNKIVISSKVLKREKEDELRAKEYDLIKVGDVMKGTVVRLEPYGAFVRFNYNQALIRLSQIRHEFIQMPREALALNEEIEVKIIKKENGKLEASRKALLKSPFELYIENHKKPDVVKGTVKQKLPFGILIELANNVTGLLHESEYAWNPKSNFEDYIKLNDELELMIINIDPKKEKISLSKKALEDNPWNRVEAKKGDVVDCKITEIIPGKGVNVTTLGIDAFISIRDLSNEKITKIEDVYNVDDVLKCAIVDIDAPKWHIILSAKKYEEYLEKQDYEKYMSTEEKEEAVTLKDLFKDILK